MGEVKWTKEQSLAITEKGQNILVAAAAGSGKTAVLAAAEMRGRVLDAIYKRIEENPDDKHLQKQITLLSKANICTIDSFCLEVVKNNFFEIGISPNLKIAETTEIEILKEETLEEIFDEKYEIQDKNFINLVDKYTSYRGDEGLKNIIFEIYRYIQSMPFPKKWLEEKVEEFNLKDISFEKTIWGEVLFTKVREELNDRDIEIKK